MTVAMFRGVDSASIEAFPAVSLSTYRIAESTRQLTRRNPLPLAGGGDVVGIQEHNERGRGDLHGRPGAAADRGRGRDDHAEPPEGAERTRCDDGRRARRRRRAGRERFGGPRRRAGWRRRRLHGGGRPPPPSGRLAPSAAPATGFFFE